MKTVPRPLLSELPLYFLCHEGRSQTHQSKHREDRDKGSPVLSYTAQTEHGKNFLTDEFTKPAGSWWSARDHCKGQVVSETYRPCL